MGAKNFFALNFQEIRVFYEFRSGYPLGAKKIPLRIGWLFFAGFYGFQSGYPLGAKKSSRFSKKWIAGSGATFVLDKRSGEKSQKSNE